jgi:hypothetical protein
MPIKLILRYQKKDQFGNSVFLASSNIENEKASHATLLKIEQKLKDMNLETFLPVYSNEAYQYSSARFKFYKGEPLIERNLYTVEFDIKKSERNNKTYINCFAHSIKLHSIAQPIDYGETLHFDF